MVAECWRSKSAPPEWTYRYPCRQIEFKYKREKKRIIREWHCWKKRNPEFLEKKTEERRWLSQGGMKCLERRACHWRMLLECFFQNHLSLKLHTFSIRHFFPPSLSILIFANKK